MNEQKTASGGKTATIIRVVVLVLMAVAFLLIFILSMPKSEKLSDIWDERTILGNKDAKNHYVMYTDAMCPYCDYFSRAVMSNQAEFEKYLADNDVVFEMRITDFLREYGMADEYSTQSAEAILCATEQNKFWDYYHSLMTALDEDYHSKGIGNSKTAPHISDITDEYWLKVAVKAGVNTDGFKKCYDEHQMLDKVKDNTLKTAKIMQQDGQSGMPYFSFGSFKTTGFDSSWGWSYVKRYLDAGLKK